MVSCEMVHACIERQLPHQPSPRTTAANAPELLSSPPPLPGALPVVRGIFPPEGPSGDGPPSTPPEVAASRVCASQTEFHRSQTLETDSSSCLRPIISSMKRSRPCGTCLDCHTQQLGGMHCQTVLPWPARRLVAGLIWQLHHAPRSGTVRAALPCSPVTIRCIHFCQWCGGMGSQGCVVQGCCITLEAPETGTGDDHADGDAGTGAPGTSEPRLYPTGAPSLLGAPYAGILSRGRAVVGSSKEDVADAAAALDVLRRRAGVADPSAAEAELRAGIEEAWPPFSSWRTAAVRRHACIRCRGRPRWLLAVHQRACMHHLLSMYARPAQLRLMHTGPHGLGLAGLLWPLQKRLPAGSGRRRAQRQQAVNSPCCVRRALCSAAACRSQEG